MAIIDEIKVEEYLICYTDNGYPQDQPFYARFGILETIEQHNAQNEGCLSGDKEWREFDENIFYWISAYWGETIQQHTKENPLNDFYYVGEENE
jgi:hypothetical protein